jgi:hypothetical protein
MILTDKDLCMTRAKIEELKADWPDDDWYTISDSLELHAFINEEGRRAACLYPVHCGVIDLSFWQSLQVDTPDMKAVLEIYHESIKKGAKKQ